jgi:hypothetical protein
LTEFREVLVRLARYEADVDAGTEERVAAPLELMRRWVEDAKLNAALHRRYGGTVGLLAAWPYAHGARQALVRHYLANGKVEILHAGVRQYFDAVLAAPPQVAFQGTHPDFTPYWKRPIPPSYMTD